MMVQFFLPAAMAHCALIGNDSIHSMKIEQISEEIVFLSDIYKRKFLEYTNQTLVVSIAFSTKKSITTKRRKYLPFLSNLFPLAEAINRYKFPFLGIWLFIKRFIGAIHGIQEDLILLPTIERIQNQCWSLKIWLLVVICLIMGSFVTILPAVAEDTTPTITNVRFLTTNAVSQPLKINITAKGKEKEIVVIQVKVKNEGAIYTRCACEKARMALMSLLF